MAAHTYSAEELLHVRQKPLRKEMHRKLYDRLKKDAELGKQLSLNSNSVAQANVLMGEMMCMQIHHPRRSDPNHFHNLTCEPETRLDGLNRQLDGTDGEWRYRGRTDSEQAEGQPIPAPSGIVAQKDEGFQKFYKAVVSPTHVRVTAGGRIVPNTRGSLSPAPKWPVDKPSSDPVPLSRSTSNADGCHTYGFPIPPTAFAPIGPMFSGYGPAMMPSMAPPPPAFPMMPWHPGMAFGTTFPYPSGSSSELQPQVQVHDTTDIVRQEQVSEAGSLKAASVKGPSPEKSGLRAGMPWIMPPNPSFYSMPYQPPGYSFQPPPQMMLSPPPPADGGTASRPAMTKESANAAKSAPISFGSHSVAIAQSPMSSIRPSEITKNQIGVLRNSLKYLEDQLLYNRHQVDEKALEQQVDLVKQQIRQFEKNLENQLTFEGNHYPKSSVARNQITSSASSRGHLGSKASIASEDSLERQPYKVSNASSASLEHSVRSKGTYEKKTCFSSGINSTKSVSAFAPIKAGARALGDRATQTNYRGGSLSLPSNAALAPPFEPQRRSEVTSHSLSRPSDSRALSDREQAAFHSGRSRQSGTDSQSVTSETAVKPLPYLIGYLPAGINPRSARDTDYAYTRPLTEDELRARHMYWGKTPRHLQKGLPKFDGKDFYPPSPTKRRSADRIASSSSSTRRLPVGNAALDYGLSNMKVEADLFRSLEHTAPRATRGPLGVPTQSETMARSSCGTDETAASIAGYHRAGSCVTHVGAHTSSIDVAEAGPRNSSPSLPDKSSSDEAEDERDLLFKGRQGNRKISTKTHSNEIWRSMLKKGKTSSSAVPVAVSSTTVQGVLPQYSGYATASLTPAIANSTTPPPRLALAKAYDTADGTLAGALGERKRENLPPMAGSNSTSTMARTASSGAPS